MGLVDSFLMKLKWHHRSVKRKGAAMAEQEIRRSIAEKIQTLQSFRGDIIQWHNDRRESPQGIAELRSRINRNMRKANEIIRETGSLKVMTLSPPPISGGLMIRNADPFGFVIDGYYGMSVIPFIVDMIDAAIGVLESPEFLEDYIKLSQQPEPELQLMAKGLQQVIQLCRRFPLVARQLQARHGNRATLTINDEYDVQDLFHGLLKIDFDDIRPEEWTPSYAGKSARMDFLLKRESIVVEVKKTRATLGAKEVGDELIIDIKRYESHPGCKSLVCFVYDPEFRIGNPAGLEGDLTCTTERMDVRVIISPNNH
jgi:REase_DpnII-MboI